MSARSRPRRWTSAPPKAVEVSAVPADVADFGAVYEEAGIELPLHGYGVDKVGEMLASPRLASLNREVRAAAVLAALEAAQVPPADVIQDAVKRDKALDAFEAAKRRELDELHAGAEARIAAIKEEIETFLREKNAEMEGLKQARETAERAFADSGRAQAPGGGAPARRGGPLPRREREPRHHGGERKPAEPPHGAERNAVVSGPIGGSVMAKQLTPLGRTLVVLCGLSLFGYGLYRYGVLDKIARRPRARQEGRGHGIEGRLRRRDREPTPRRRRRHDASRDTVPARPSGAAVSRVPSASPS